MRSKPSLWLLLFLATPLLATTYVVPTDRTLAGWADAIVVGTAGTSFVQRTPAGGIETVTAFTLEEVIKGDASMTEIQVHEPGGVLGDRAMVIPGVPTFQPGERLILFLTQTPQRTWAVTDLALGRFTIVRDLVLRSDVVGWDLDGRPHVERARSLAGFLAFLRGSEDVNDMPVAANSFLLTPQNIEPGAPGNGITAIQTAMSAWSGKAGSNVSINYGGTGGGTGGLQTPDGKNTILFEQDLSSFGASPFSCGSGGVLGIGGITEASGTHTYGGVTFDTIVEGDVEMNKGIANCTTLFSSGDFNTAVAHEVGHTLGFRHADQTRQDNASCSGDPTLECSSSAVMKSSIPLGINAALQTWDLHAVGSLYNGTSTSFTSSSYTIDLGGGIGGRWKSFPVTYLSLCTLSIATQPQSVTINSGQQAALTVGVDSLSNPPQTFQWFIGRSGDTSNPMSGQTQAQLNVTPTSTTSYWVQVSGPCTPAVNSATATVTVNTSCPTVTVSQPTATPQGGGFSLTASATGGNSFTFRWFQGPTSGSGTFIGSGNPFMVTPTTTTTYWVQVINDCNNTANSATVTVTVVCPTVTAPKPSANAQPSGGFLLSDAPSGGSGFTFQWFVGTTSGVGTPAGSGNPLFVNPSATTGYWVQVTNSCGNSADSPVITINVVCMPPSIVTQPQNQTVTTGGTVTLSLTAGGTAPSVNWFQGTPPDMSQPAGNGSSITSPPINANTSFWALVTNNCGSVSSQAASITVAAVCTPPTITSATATPSQIPDGQSSTLAVVATGTSLSYQWFQGNPGDTSTPVPGGNAASVIVSPSVTTMYWVQVTSGCGAAAANSGGVLVQVSCVNPQFTLPGAIMVASGDSATITLNVTGSQPIHVSWFQGIPIDTSHPVGTDSATLTTGPLHGTTTFWAHLQNDCGAVNTTAITVTVKTGRRRSVRH